MRKELEMDMLQREVVTPAPKPSRSWDWVVVTILASVAVTFLAASIYTQKVDLEPLGKSDVRPCISAYEYRQLLYDMDSSQWRSAAIGLRLYDQCLEGQIRDIRNGLPAAPLPTIR
jgi:hypothetical protein